jgi:hypothetical protein
VGGFVETGLQKLKTKLQSRGILCPYPDYWRDLFMIIEAKNIKNIEIPLPLILAGWIADDYEKAERFYYHLSIANDLGILTDVERYLDSLPETAFLTGAIGQYKKVEEAMSEVPTLLKKIQKIDQTIVDEISLYDLFVEIDLGLFEKSEVQRGQSEMGDLLVDLYEIYVNVRDRIDPMLEFDDFCSRAFPLEYF